MHCLYAPCCPQIVPATAISKHDGQPLFQCPCPCAPAPGPPLPTSSLCCARAVRSSLMCRCLVSSTSICHTSNAWVDCADDCTYWVPHNRARWAQVHDTCELLRTGCLPNIAGSVNTAQHSLGNMFPLYRQESHTAWLCPCRPPAGCS